MKLFSFLSHSVNPSPSKWTLIQAYWIELAFWKKITAGVLCITLIASIVPLRTYFQKDMQSYELVGNMTTSTGIAGDAYVPQEETVRIAINLGGGLDFDCAGSRFLSTETTNNFDCKYQEYAAKKGIISADYNPTSYTSRAAAVKSLIIASGMSPSSQDVPYTDVVGEKGYISRAYEVGCLSADASFHPDTYISRTEMQKLSDCIHSVTQSAISKAPEVSVTTNNQVSLGNQALSTVSQSSSGNNTPNNNTTTSTVIEKQVIIEKIVTLSGSQDVLPKSPNTLLGYDEKGNIQTVRMGSGVVLSDGMISALTLASEPIFNSAPESPQTVSLNTSSIYPSAPISQFQLITGSFPGGYSSSSSSTASSPVSSVFGRIGSIVGMLGDYTTDIVSESGSNLYFSDIRAQAAMSGIVSTLSSDIADLSGALSALSGSGFAQVFSDIGILSGSIANAQSDVLSLSGITNLISGDILALSGNLSALQNNLFTATGNIAGLSTDIATLNISLLNLSGSMDTLSGSISGIQNSLISILSDVSSLSGIVSTKVGLGDISAQGPITYNSLAGVFGFMTGSDGQILAMSGTDIVWKNPSIISAPVDSVFGRTGAISAQAGDYTTDLVTEGSNLYFTDSRAQNALSGSINNLSGSIALANANYTTLLFSVAGIGNSQLTLLGDMATLSGSLATTNSNLFTATGNIATLTTNLGNTNTNVFALSGSLNSTITNLFNTTGALATTNSSLNTTITNLFNTTGALNATIANLFSTTGALNSTIASLFTATGNILSLQNNLFTATGTLATHTTQISTLNTNLTTTNTNLFNTTGALATTNSNLFTATGNIATLTTNLGNTNTNVFALSGSLNTTITNLFNTTGALATTNSNLNTTITNLFNTTGSLNTTIANLFSTTGALNSTIASLFTATGNILSLQNNLFTATGTLATHTTQISTLNTNLTTTNTNLFNTTGALATTNSNLFTATGNITTLSGRVNTLSGSVSTLFTNLAATNGNLFSATGTLATHTTQISTLNTNLATTNTNLFNTTGALATTNSNLATTNSNLFTATGNIATLTTNLGNTNTNVFALSGSLNSTITNLFNTTGALATTNSNLNTTITNLFNTTGSLNTTIANLFSTTGALNSTIASLFTATGNILSLQNNLFTATGTLATHTTQISTLNTNLFTATGNIATLTTNLGNTNTNVFALSGSLNSTITNLFNTTGALATTNSNLNTTITNLFNTTGSLNTTIANLFSTTGALNSTIASLFTATGNILSLQNNLFTATGTLATHTTQISTLNTNLFTATGNITTLSGRVNTLSGSVSTLFTNLAATNGNLFSATGTLATHTTQISTLNTNLFTATGNIATLNTNLGNTNTNVFALSGSLNTTITNLFNTTGALATTNSNLNTTITNLFNTTGSLNTTIANLFSTTGALNSTIASLFTATGNILSLQNNLFTATGTLATHTTQISTLNTNLFTATGNITTLSGRVNTLSGSVSTLFTNLAATNGNLFSATGTLATHTTQISTLNTNLGNTNTNVFALSGSLNSTITNLFNTTGALATKISLTSLSATGGITYNNTTGEFGDAFTFGNGLTRVGNSVGIGTLTGGMLTGFTAGQLVFGSPTNGLTQASGLYWNTASGQLGIGTNVTNQALTVSGGLSSSKYLLGLDLSLLPIANGQSALTSWWGLQLIGNKQSSVDYTPTNYGAADDYGVLIPNQQATKIALMIRGATGQSGNLTQWETSTGMALGAVTANGNFAIGTGTTSAKLHIYDATTTSGTIMKIEVPKIQTGSILQITGSGGRNLLRIAQNGADPLDIERVIIGQGGISSTKPDSLARDQLYVFGRINTSWDHFAADFLNTTTTLTADAITPEGLQFDRITATAQYSNGNITGISGARTIAVNTIATAAGVLGAYTVTQSSLNPVYEARAIVNTANTTTRAVVGFTDRAINATTLNTDTNNSTNEVFFRKQAASTVWQAVTRSTANATEVVTATTVPVNQWNIFRIEVEDSNRVARFYINGTLVATHTGTTIPASTIRFGHQIGLLITNTTANSMGIDYVRMWSDDPAATGKEKVTIQKPKSTEDTGFLTPSDYTGSSLLPTFISTSRQYLGDISFILSKMGDTNSGSIALANSLGDDGTVTIEEYGNYILNNLKQSLEKLSGVQIDTILHIQGLESQTVKTKKLTTDELCVGDRCFSADEIIGGLTRTGGTSSNGEIIQNVYNSYTTVVNSTGSTTETTAITELSVADRAILDGIDYVDSTLIPKVEVIFKKVVTFANDVVFQSRIIFSDPDMAGQISIQPGRTQVYVKFERPYAGVPVITLTPVGHFQMGVVAESSRYGFTIEIENPTSRTILFNWVALMISGAAKDYDTPSSQKTIPVTTPKETTSSVTEVPTVSGEVIVMPQEDTKTSDIPSTDIQEPVVTESGSTADSGGSSGTISEENTSLGTASGNQEETPAEVTSTETPNTTPQDSESVVESSQSAVSLVATEASSPTEAPSVPVESSTSSVDVAPITADPPVSTESAPSESQ